MNRFNKHEYHAYIILSIQSENVLTSEEILEVALRTEQYLNGLPLMFNAKPECKVGIRVHLEGEI